jgi:hypothetical protein
MHVSHSLRFLTNRHGAKGYWVTGYRTAAAAEAVDEDNQTSNHVFG